MPRSSRTRTGKAPSDSLANGAEIQAPAESPAVPLQTRLDNKSVAGMFYEVADLMEINNDDSFRVRSYRRAAEAIEALPSPIAELATDPKKLLEIPGIGKGMCA